MTCRRRSFVLSVLIGVLGLGFTQPLAQTRPRDASRGFARLASTISADQLERLGARVATLTTVLDRFESDARARGLASGWRQAAADTLLRLPLEHLQRIEREALTLDALTSALRAPVRHGPGAGSADGDPNLLGDRSRDLVYTPTTPCRFIDTRAVGGKIDGVRAFSFDLAGVTYGGSASCHNQFVNASAKDIGALAMNVTLVDTSTAAAPGFVAVKPLPQSPTVSLLNWHDQGPHVQVANLAIVTLRQPATSGAGVDFVIQTSGPVHIIVDIFGAFVTPIRTALETEHVFDSVVVPNNSANAISAVCPSSHRLTGGGCFSDQFGNYLSAISLSSHHVFCQARNTSGLDVVLFARAICARVPGR